MTEIRFCRNMQIHVVVTGQLLELWLRDVHETIRQKTTIPIFGNANKNEWKQPKPLFPIGLRCFATPLYLPAVSARIGYVRRWGKQYNQYTYMYISWSADSTLQVFCGHNFTLQRTMSIMLLILKARQTGCSCCEGSTRDNSDSNYESKWWKDWDLWCALL